MKRPMPRRKKYSRPYMMLPEVQDGTTAPTGAATSLFQNGTES